MRITIASSGLGHVARGIEAWAADLGRALAQRDLDVSLCKGGVVMFSQFRSGGTPA